MGRSGVARAVAIVVLVVAVAAGGATILAWTSRTSSLPRSVGVVAGRAETTTSTTVTTAPRSPVTSPGVSLPSGERDQLGSHSAKLEDLPRRSPVVPVGVRIEGSGITGPVVPAGIDGVGAMAVGTDPDVVAWYEHGPSPGEDGSSVLAGHVDYGGRTGVFFRLTEVAPGTLVVVTYADRSEQRFEVVARRQYPKSDLPVEEIFDRTGAPRLVLITCGGEFDAAARSYRENVVVSVAPL
ncbi:MAG: class F sortase [Acidimicrobiales bacterium]